MGDRLRVMGKARNLPVTCHLFHRFVFILPITYHLSPITYNLSLLYLALHKNLFPSW